MLKLTIDTARWQAHQQQVLAQCPGLVPVAKGNGYGFGFAALAQAAAALDLDTIAVGTFYEVNEMRSTGWSGDIVVLNPWRPHDDSEAKAIGDPRVIWTVSRAGDLKRVPRYKRLIIEVATSMHRHGIDPAELASLPLDKRHIEGWCIHLPAAGSLEEARQLAAACVAVRPDIPIWFSHLSFDDYQTISAELATPAKMRVGTRLWLGDSGAYRVTGTVLDVHRLPKGTPVGYHGARTAKDGCVLVISGGTSHGVALAAPATAHSLKQRLIPVVEGLSEAYGHIISPFTLAGRKQPFMEPPHMHSSLIFVEGPGFPAQVGDEIPVTVRMTTTYVDEIEFN